LFRSCLQGTAATKWDLCATKYEGTKRTEKNFKQCLRDYLKVTAKCTNLGDQVIRWLRLRSKPGHMRFEDFLNRRVQILDYVKKGYLRRRMDLPYDVELCKQVFLAQPKPHRIKYAEKHRVGENNMLKLQDFFEGCHDADVHSGIFAKIVEGKKKAKEDDKAKKLSRRDRKPHVCVDHHDRYDRDRYGYRPYERHHKDDRQYNCDPKRQERKDSNRYRDDKSCRDD